LIEIEEDSLMAQKTKKTAKEVNPVILQNGIFVAGHPRSGTSLACQLLESAGVRFLSDLGADEYNKDGYYELFMAKELEKKLIEKAMTDENITELNQVIRKLNSTSGLSGLKIVHIPSIFFYRHIAKNMRVVFIFRNPSDTKSSMLRRGISQFKLSWFDNNNALIAAHENIPKSIVISYDSLMEGNPRVARAFKKLGFNVNMATIKKGYQTQKNSQLVLNASEEKLYNLLKKLEKKSLK
jgi:hypothetical protein